MAGERKRKMLGEILIEQGAITKQQLETALKEQQKKGELIGEALLKLGFVKEEDIVIALAAQFNFPYLPIENFEINPQAIKAVPADLIQKYVFIPIDKIKSILTIVMSDPINETAIKEIEELSGCHVQAFVSTVTEIKKAIKHHYHLSLNEHEDPQDHVSKVSFRQAKEQYHQDA